jgi:pimeloyl-ACP methyl ester carboxylesterase
MQEYYEDCARTPFPALSSQVLLIAGGADEVAHIETSRAAAARWPNAVLREKPEGDHFLLHHDEEVPREIATFVQGIESARAALAS